MQKYSSSAGIAFIRKEARFYLKSVVFLQSIRAGIAVMRKVMGCTQYKHSKSIFIFVSRNGEISTLPIALHAYAARKGMFSCFRLTSYTVDIYVPNWKIGDSSMKTAPIESIFGLIMEYYRAHKEGWSASTTHSGGKSNIDLVLVPGLMFDHNGGRIGQGKGCYDRFLSLNKIYKIGLAHDFQVRKSLENYLRPHDVPMDMVISPSQKIEIFPS